MRISNFVFPSYKDTISTQSNDTTYAPTGLPGAPRLNVRLPRTAPFANAPTNPATPHENNVNFFAPRAFAIPTPMPNPIALFAILAIDITISANAVFPNHLPICSKIVPAINVQKSPCAIPLNALINQRSAYFFTVSLKVICAPR